MHEAEQLVADPSASSLSNLPEPLTERERELLTYLATHYHLREIASRVYLSHNTVKTQTKAIYRKLGAASRAKPSPSHEPEESFKAHRAVSGEMDLPI